MTIPEQRRAASARARSTANPRNSPVAGSLVAPTTDRPTPTAGPHTVLIRIVEIAGNDSRPETETARRFDEEHREIPAAHQPACEVVSAIAAWRRLSRADARVRMTAPGTERTFRDCGRKSAFGGKADIGQPLLTNVDL
jgi:hypothetical protein